MSPRRLVLAGVLALAVGAGAAPAQAAVPSCTVHGRAIAQLHGSRVVSTSGKVVVYRVGGSMWDTFWACERGSRRRGLVGRDDASFESSSEYGSSTAIVGLQLRGPWVLATIETGEGAYDGCTKYMVSNCSGPVDSLELVNAETATRLDVARIVVNSTTPAGAPVLTQWLRTDLSSVGAVAWLTRSATSPVSAGSSGSVSETLWGCVAGGPARSLSCPATTLASGAVDPGSLAFTGATLGWTLGGRPQSATLS